jgi:predicted lipid-binding transport protein (Tim44 family)
MTRWRGLAALLVVAALLALSPSLADARAGGGYSLGGGGRGFMSQGSLGSRTFNAPLNRSMTPYAQRQGYGSPYGYYGAAHPFWSGLAGGLFGSFLGRMLFPGWGMGYGGFGFFSIFGWLFILWGAWALYRMVFGGMAHYPRSGTGLGLGGGMGGGMFGGPGLGASGYGAPMQAPSAPLAISGHDYQAFETILKQVQQAWSDANLEAMRHVATPEMLHYFAEELASNESQGVRNRVEQVELTRGDLREAWDEGRMHYATCYLRWRALDYTVRADARPGDAGAVVSGDPAHAVEAAELWTFARSPGGTWLLSAIQQA